MIELWHGDCMELMRNIPDKSIDMVLCDLPYGVTNNEWDLILSLNLLWIEYKRIIKNNNAIVLHGIEPFSTELRISNIKQYRHEWYWNKNNSAGFVTANIRPFSIIENIIVFSKEKVNYYPIMEKRGNMRQKGGYTQSSNYNINPMQGNYNNEYYPKNLLNFSNASQVNKFHPTQKPVKLLEYLIKTYTKENELIVDNCMGSGSTGIACITTNRNFIGIEKEKKYYDIAVERIDIAKQTQLKKFM